MPQHCSWKTVPYRKDPCWSSSLRTAAHGKGPFWRSLFLVLHFTPFLIHNISVKNYYSVPERTLNQISQHILLKLPFLINFKHVSFLPSCLPIWQFSSLPIGLFVRFCFSICSFVNLLIACHFHSTYPVEFIFILVIAVEKAQILSSTQYLSVLFRRAWYWHVVFLRPHVIWICKYFKQYILVFTLYEVTKIHHTSNY